MRRESFLHVGTLGIAGERREITNRRGFLNPFSENTKYVTEGPENPKRYPCATQRARRLAWWGANMEKGAK